MGERYGISAAELRRLREAARRAVERSTLRAVALDVGMSPTGLRQFIEGTVPYGPTIEKLRAWYARDLTFERVDAVQARILPNLPDEARRRALRWWAAGELLALYQESGEEPPPWVSEVVEERT